MRIVALITSAFIGLISLIGATFTLDSTSVTSIGSGATDTANSLVGAMADLLPVLVPLLVVGFIIAMIMRAFKTR